MLGFPECLEMWKMGRTEEIWKEEQTEKRVLLFGGSISFSKKTEQN